MQVCKVGICFIEQFHQPRAARQLKLNSASSSSCTITMMMMQRLNGVVNLPSLFMNERNETILSVCVCVSP